MGRPRSSLTPLERRQRYRQSAKGKTAKRRHDAAYRQSLRYKQSKRVETREQKHKLRMALYAAHKNQPCMDCGGTFDPVCMDFDHRPGETKVGNISRLVANASVDVVKTEIAKCDVVCANCHRLRTHRKRDHARMTLERRGIEYHADAPQLSLTLEPDESE